MRLAATPELAERLELVIAGLVSDTEREFLTRGALAGVIRVTGLVTNTRAIGLQRAADGLLLVTGGEHIPGKVYEYLAASKPIFAVTTPGSVAANLLAEAGNHTICAPGRPAAIAAALAGYLEHWSRPGAHYETRPEFDLATYEYASVGKRMLDLINSISEREALKL